MRQIIILITALTFVGCNESGLPGAAGLNPSLISDSWEYVNPDGACGSANLFGDTDTYSFNCVHYIQVVRFADGAAYVTINVGPTSYPYDYTWSQFLPQDTTTFEKDVHMGVSGNYQVSGNLGRRTPTVFLNFSHSTAFTDSAAQSFTLQKVVLSQ